MENNQMIKMYEYALKNNHYITDKYKAEIIKKIISLKEDI